MLFGEKSKAISEEHKCVRQPRWQGLPFRLWETQIEQKSQQEKETQLQIRDRGNPSDRFGVNRVQCEKAGGDERKKAIAEKAFGKNEEKQDDGDVQNQIHQMKPEGEPTKDFVTDEIGKTRRRRELLTSGLVQNITNFSGQIFWWIRLLKEKRAARYQRTQHLRFFRIARGENYRDGGVNAPNSLERTRAVQSGHHHIQYDQGNLSRISLEFLNCLTPIPRNQDRVSQSGKNLVRHLAQTIVIFREKDGLGSSSHRDFLDLSARFDGGFGCRQINSKNAALADLTINLDVPERLVDDAKNGRQAP